MTTKTTSTEPYRFGTSVPISDNGSYILKINTRINIHGVPVTDEVYNMYIDNKVTLLKLLISYTIEYEDIKSHICGIIGNQDFKTNLKLYNELVSEDGLLDDLFSKLSPLMQNYTVALRHKMCVCHGDGDWITEMFKDLSIGDDLSDYINHMKASSDIRSEEELEKHVVKLLALLGRFHNDVMKKIQTI